MNPILFVDQRWKEKTKQHETKNTTTDAQVKGIESTRSENKK